MSKRNSKKQEKEEKDKKNSPKKKRESSKTNFRRFSTLKEIYEKYWQTESRICRQTNW